MPVPLEDVVEVFPRLDDGHASPSDRETSPQEAQEQSQVSWLGLCFPVRLASIKAALLSSPAEGAGLGAGELLGCEAMQGLTLGSPRRDVRPRVGELLGCELLNS